MLVYVGRDVTTSDVFAKLVDAGRKVSDVQATLRDVERYLMQLKAFRIGNIVRVESDGREGFDLKLACESPSHVKP